MNRDEYMKITECVNHIFKHHDFKYAELDKRIEFIEKILLIKNDDKEYVRKKFGLSDAEFERIMNLPKKTYFNYPNYDKSYINLILEKYMKL